MRIEDGPGVIRGRRFRGAEDIIESGLQAEPFQGRPARVLADDLAVHLRGVLLVQARGRVGARADGGVLIFVAADEHDVFRQTQRQADAAVQGFKSLIDQKARVGIPDA